jgi:hypothetical protein
MPLLARRAEGTLAADGSVCEPIDKKQELRERN